MPFDIAIRVYLDSFRLPGESQKINRIMESFGGRYHMQCPELFKNPDVVYILAYSTIMLNTDQHNSQVCLQHLACVCGGGGGWRWVGRGCMRVCVLAGAWMAFVCVSVRVLHAECRGCLFNMLSSVACKRHASAVL